MGRSLITLGFGKSDLRSKSSRRRGWLPTIRSLFLSTRKPVRAASTVEAPRDTSGGSPIAAEKKQANFTYNGAGQTASITTYGDGFEGSGEQVATGTYTYDGDGRVSTLTYTHGESDIDAYGTSTPIAYGLTYDAASNITQVVSADGTDNVTLDACSQLKTASLTTESYSYDQNGNRVGGGYVTGADNLLLSDGTYKYQYDKDGNVIKRTKISDGSVTLYAWNYADQLTQVTSETSAGFGGYVTMIVTYSYDAFGNQIRRTERTYSSSGPTSATTYSYTVYNGANPYLVVTDANELADGAADAAITQRDLYGPAVDQVLATDSCTGSSSGVLFGLPDYQDTIEDVVNTSGAAVNHVEFNSFGAIQNGTMAADFLFGKAGMRFDPATGLYGDDARSYNPFTGKFESADPTGMAGSGTNLEAYCGNSPVENEDPSGECYTGLASNSSGLSFGEDDLAGLLFGPPDTSWSDAISMVDECAQNGLVHLEDRFGSLERIAVQARELFLCCDGPHCVRLFLGHKNGQRMPSAHAGQVQRHQLPHEEGGLFAQFCFQFGRVDFLALKRRHFPEHDASVAGLDGNGTDVLRAEYPVRVVLAREGRSVLVSHLYPWACDPRLDADVRLLVVGQIGLLYRA
jgi:RHS repeat-associated protein